MLNKKYSIGKMVLNIYCEIEEYVDIIEKRMLMFNQTFYNNETNNNASYIKIYSDKTVYKINGCEKIINGKIIHTDLYPLVNNVLSNIIIDDCHMLSHSSVICYNNVGVLVVGDFGHGKTKLCLEAEKHGITVLSTDQTLLKQKSGYLKIENASKYMRIRDKNDIIINVNNNDVKIKIILNLVGLCNRGITEIELVENNYHKIKTLFKYFTWHSDVPLFTDNSLLNIDRIKIKKWLTSIDIPLYNVRGDVKEIVKKIKELII